MPHNYYPNNNSSYTVLGLGLTLTGLWLKTHPWPWVLKPMLMCYSNKGRDGPVSTKGKFMGM